MCGNWISCPLPTRGHFQSATLMDVQRLFASRVARRLAQAIDGGEQHLSVS